MSNQAEHLEPECVVMNSCGALEMVLETRAKDLGGFAVRRALPAAQRQMIGPWIFFDHMGPAHFPAGQGIDVRPHPHVNLATVTYLFEGEILHRDSLGSVQTIRPGDINLMVAGSGITHSERESPECRNSPHTQHGLQLWLALPEEHEEIAPAFYHYPAAQLPTVSLDEVPVRVMIGSAYGVTSPVKTYADTLYVEAQLHAGQSFVLPEAEERALYVVSGSVRAGDKVIQSHSLAVFSSQSGVVVTASEPSRLALIGGQKLGPRFIEWNFVSSRADRIQQAKADWKAQQFAKVPGDDTEFIPLPQ